MTNVRAAAVALVAVASAAVAVASGVPAVWVTEESLERAWVNPSTAMWSPETF